MEKSEKKNDVYGLILIAIDYVLLSINCSRIIVEIKLQGKSMRFMYKK
jgi:hypothetical protein